MRNLIGGAVLASVCAGGVVFVLGGPRLSSHCGPCVAAPELPFTPTQAEPAPVGDPVVEVVDLEQIFSSPATPSAAPRVSFDEPPLASRPGEPRSRSGSDVIQASYVVPVSGSLETAPMPRPSRGAEPSPFSRPTDPY